MNNIHRVFGRRCTNSVILAAFLFTTAWASNGFAQQRLFKAAPQAFVAPGKLFGVKVPPTWTVHLHKNDPYTYEFRPGNPQADASLMIRRIQVPLGANPRQLLLKAVEQRLNKLPNLKVLKQGDTSIATLPAASITAIYSYQGNLQYPRAVEEVYLVHKDEAFIFHFECFEPYAGALAKDLNSIYQTFQPRVKPAKIKALNKPEKSFPEVDKIPY